MTGGEEVCRCAVSRNGKQSIPGHEVSKLVVAVNGVIERVVGVSASLVRCRPLARAPSV